MFGSSYAGNAYAEIFARLGALGDIRIYALNPCREFWDDVDTSRRGALAGWARRQDKVGDQTRRIRRSFLVEWSVRPARSAALGAAGPRIHSPAQRIVAVRFRAACFRTRFPRERRRWSSSFSKTSSTASRRPRTSTIGKGKPSTRESVSSHVPEFDAKPKSSRTKSGRCFATTKNLPLNGNVARIRFHEIAVLIPDAAVDDYIDANRKRLSKAAPNPDRSRKPQHRRREPCRPRPSSCCSNCRAAASRAHEMVRLLTHPALNGEDGTRDRCRNVAAMERGAGHFLRRRRRRSEGHLHPARPLPLGSGDQAARARHDDDRSARRQTPQFMRNRGDRASSYLPFEVAQDELETAARFMRTARALIADAIAIRDARLTPGNGR